jgi:hypothetical protein
MRVNGQEKKHGVLKRFEGRTTGVDYSSQFEINVKQRERQMMMMMHEE